MGISATASPDPADDFLAALSALDEPAADTADTSTELPDTLDVDDVVADGTETDGEEPTVTDETDDTDQTAEEADPSESETYVVKVDGEEVEVSLDEALKGYMRRADYQRKTQELARSREEFTNAVSQFQGQLDRLSTLDAVWDRNPSEVLSAFALSTENPSQAIIEQVKAVAVAGKADDRLRRIFGITDDVVAQLRAELEGTEAARAQQAKVSEGEAAKAELEQLREQQRVQAALAEYEQQITTIASTYGVDLTDPAARAEFRQKLSRYALENEIRDLTKAYKLMRAEETEAQAAAEAAQRAKAKASNVAGRRTTTASGTTPLRTKATSFDDAFDAAWNKLGLG